MANFRVKMSDGTEVIVGLDDHNLIVNAIGKTDRSFRMVMIKATDPQDPGHPFDLFLSTDELVWMREIP